MPVTAPSTMPATSATIISPVPDGSSETLSTISQTVTTINTAGRIHSVPALTTRSLSSRCANRNTTSATISKLMRDWVTSGFCTHAAPPRYAARTASLAASSAAAPACAIVPTSST